MNKEFDESTEEKEMAHRWNQEQPVRCSGAPAGKDLICLSGYEREGNTTSLDWPGETQTADGKKKSGRRKVQNFCCVPSCCSS